MKNLKKILSIFSLASAIPLSLFSIHSISEEVEMIETVGYCVTRTGCFERAEVKLRNVAFEKHLVLNMKTPSGDVDGYDCFFDRLLGNGSEEIWICDSFHRANTTYESFAFHYQVAGNEFFDTNFGAGYPTGSTHDVILGKRFPVKLGHTSDEGSELSLTIFAAKHDGASQVDVVYTNDDWQSTHVVSAVLDVNSSQTQIDVFKVDVPWGFNDQVEFAVSIRINGEENWDNNFGQNYFFVK